MAIIEGISPDLPLSQGDVLKDVRLFLTRDAGAEEGGEPQKASMNPLAMKPAVYSPAGRTASGSVTNLPSSFAFSAMNRCLDGYMPVHRLACETRDSLPCT